MPAFRVGKPRWSLRNASLQVIPAVVDTELVYDGAVFAEPSSIVTGSTITVTRPGLYWIYASARRLTVAVSGESRLKIKTNGVTRVFEVVGPTTLAWHLSVTGLLELAEGDVVSTVIQGHPTLATSIQGGTQFFYGFRCGPERWT